MQRTSTTPPPASRRTALRSRSRGEVAGRDGEQRSEEVCSVRQRRHRQHRGGPRCDREAEEKSLDVTENNAQRRYAAFVNDATASIEADRAAIQEKEKLIATKEAAKAEVEEEQLA